MPAAQAGGAVPGEYAEKFPDPVRAAAGRLVIRGARPQARRVDGIMKHRQWERCPATIRLRLCRFASAASDALSGGCPDRRGARRPGLAR